MAEESLRRAERFHQGFQQNPEEQGRKPEQESENVEPAGPDDQVNDPDQPEEVISEWVSLAVGNALSLPAK